MRVQYIQGCDVCERCGAYIKHIYIITFNDGYSIRVGSECVRKVLRETNLSEKGCLYIERLMKPVERVRKKLAEWENMTYERALKKRLLVMKWDDETKTHRNQTPEEFEESKKWMLEHLSKRLREEEEALNKVLEEKGKKIRMRRPVV